MTFTLWRGDLPPWLRHEHVEILPGQSRACDWPDALVVLEYGAVELTTPRGGRVALDDGAVFTLAGLDGARLTNPGPPAALVAVGRRTA